MAHSKFRAARFLFLILVAFCGMSFTPPQDSKVRAKEFAVTEPQFGDLEALLHVRRFLGTYALEGKVSKLSLRIDFYKDGHKLASESFTGGWQTYQEPAARSGKLSVQIADLDYLPLGGGKKGTLRFNVALTVLDRGTSQIAWEHDTSKSVFDPTRPTRGSGTFSGHPIEDGVIPLFWRLAQDGNRVGTGNIPDEVVKDNPNADILIVSLLYE